MPSNESDDDMSSKPTGITEKELVPIENEVMPEATRKSTKTVDWFTDKKIDLASHVNKINILTC